MDAVVEFYKQGVDRTLLRENLKLSAEERIQRMQEFQRKLLELRRAGERGRKKS